MQEIFQQLEGLFIGAAPTSLLFIILVLAYHFLVHRPLTAALRERRARTQGAVENAQKAIRDAEARASEYAAKLRQARAEIYKAREERIRQWNAEKDAAVETARQASAARVSKARAELEAEADRARQAVQASAADLANQVVRAVVPVAAGSTR